MDAQPMGRIAANKLRQLALAGARDNAEREVIELIHRFLTMDAPREPGWRSQWLPFGNDGLGVIYRDGNNSLSLQVSAQDPQDNRQVAEVEGLLPRLLALYPDCIVWGRKKGHLVFCVEVADAKLASARGDNDRDRAWH